MLVTSEYIEYFLLETGILSGFYLLFKDKWLLPQEKYISIWTLQPIIGSDHLVYVSGITVCHKHFQWDHL